MNLLVMRFSAMGDVAMTVPVIHSLAQAHPEVKITFLTRDFLVPFYQWMPKNVTCIGVNLKEYKGVIGLERLYRQLKSYNFDAVADLHDVLRTKYLRTRFSIKRTKVVVIDKGRQEKHALIGHGIEYDYLKSMFERYQETFIGLGLFFPLAFQDYKMKAMSRKLDLPVSMSSKPCIGVAPFAAHECKVYPLDKMKEVVDGLADNGYHVYLFGAGKAEKEILSSWEREDVESVAGKMGGLTNELLLMSRLKLMISMDSSNMHMAAMMGTPTLSIWGATHPKAGFMAWHQSLDSVLSLELPCKPCSIYGNKPCQYGDCRCLANITPQTIIDKCNKMI
ncbi:MAG: glycosyltransferase family 9 protein [Bacteroidaceae bacterium]|nr:glycosyltransferase family 9 protein [Bacteroidaceae bacterium]